MTLGSGNMSHAVELPSGEELNEWLAVNTIEFYNEISILYGTLTEVIYYNKSKILNSTKIKVLHLRSLPNYVSWPKVNFKLC
jgi:hypothetical protein